MKIRFRNRPIFELAVHILNMDEYELANFDIGHSDMTVEFFDELTARGALGVWSVAQIWDKKSFKGEPDFDIELDYDSMDFM